MGGGLFGCCTLLLFLLHNQYLLEGIILSRLFQQFKERIVLAAFQVSFFHRVVIGGAPAATFHLGKKELSKKKIYGLKKSEIEKLQEFKVLWNI